MNFSANLFFTGKKRLNYSVKLLLLTLPLSLWSQDANFKSDKNPVYSIFPEFCIGIHTDEYLFADLRPIFGRNNLLIAPVFRASLKSIGLGMQVQKLKKGGVATLYGFQALNNFMYSHKNEVSANLLLEFFEITGAGISFGARANTEDYKNFDDFQIEAGFYFLIITPIGWRQKS